MAEPVSQHSQVIKRRNVRRKSLFRARRIPNIVRKVDEKTKLIISKTHSIWGQASKNRKTILRATRKKGDLTNVTENQLRQTSPTESISRSSFEPQSHEVTIPTNTEVHTTKTWYRLENFAIKESITMESG